MGQYIARRLISLIPVLLGVSIVVFSLIRLIPGDPVIIMLGERARVEDIERVREEMGFNRPIYMQYVDWMGQDPSRRPGQFNHQPYTGDG